MKKKTREGRCIRTMKRLDIVLERHQWVYFECRAYHPGWVQSWQYSRVVYYLKSGRLQEAVRHGGPDDGFPYVSPSEEIAW